MKVTLNINNQLYDTLVRPDEYLVETLRRIGFVSVKKGCENTSCGVCTVLIDLKAIPSCSYLTVRAEGHSITTIEGIFEEAEKISQVMCKEGSDQCGFCNPGFSLMVYAMKLEGVEPTEEGIKHYLNGNLCRCTGYVGQHKAIQAYLEVK